MDGKILVLAAGCVAIAVTAGCSGSDEPELMNFKKSGSPDELSVMPSNPLVLPESLSSLPAPRTGGVDLAYPRPDADVIKALGGNASLDKRDQAIPESDAALISRTVRNGIIRNIRGVLYSEDLEFRRTNDGRFLERLADANVYYKAYAELSLDQVAEYERTRKLGLNTPKANIPPAATR